MSAQNDAPPVPGENSSVALQTSLTGSHCSDTPSHARSPYGTTNAHFSERLIARGYMKLLGILALVAVAI